jgi:outer membrane protein assembly factor BamD (BamD/ComL family)
MKKLFVLAFGLAVVLGGAGAAGAQGGGRREPDPSVVRDPMMERDARHNLEAARQYFKLKKAYRASLSRAEEIIAGYPNFSLIDEALYIAGMSNLYMSQGKGKQPPTLAAEKHREEARMYLSRIVNEYPDSSFRKDAEKGLQSIGGASQKTESKQ